MLDDNDREVIEAPTLHPRLPEVLNGSFPFFDVLLVKAVRLLSLFLFHDDEEEPHPLRCCCFPVCEARATLSPRVSCLLVLAPRRAARALLALPHRACNISLARPIFPLATTPVHRTLLPSYPSVRSSAAGARAGAVALLRVSSPPSGLTISWRAAPGVRCRRRIAW